MRLAFALVSLAVPALVVVGTVIALMNWPMPTRVSVDLTVSRARFVVGGSNEATSTRILRSTPFESLTIEEFDSVELLRPKVLEVADPKGYNLRTDRYADSAWTPLDFEPPVRFVGVDRARHPAVTVKGGRGSEGATGSLDDLYVRPGADVRLGVRGYELDEQLPPNLSISIDGEKSRAILTLRQPSQIIADHAVLENVMPASFAADSLTYEVRLATRDPHIEVEGSAGSLALLVSLPPGEATQFPAEIPVERLEFTQMPTKSKEARSSLLTPATLTYPEYPKRGERTISPPDFLRLEGLRAFYIRQIGLDPQNKGLQLRLDGVAEVVAAVSRAYQADHRLTRFDALWLDHRLTTILVIAAWVLSATWGLYGVVAKLRDRER